MDLKQQNRSFTLGFKFLDLHLLISNGFVSSKIYAKRNNIDFIFIISLFWMAKFLVSPLMVFTILSLFGFYKGVWFG